MYRIKRIYEEPDEDGKRVLVDRLWPRGISKEKAALDAWMKTVAPTSSLRKKFNHNPALFAEFAALYKEELDRLEDRTELDRLYAAKDEKHNQAVVLKEYLEGRA